jgi:hypothetical protein
MERARSGFRSGLPSAKLEPSRSENCGVLIPRPMFPNTFTDDNAPVRNGTRYPPAESLGLTNVA